jgi:hypothetical protein
MVSAKYTEIKVKKKKNRVLTYFIHLPLQPDAPLVPRCVISIPIESDLENLNAESSVLGLRNGKIFGTT